MAAIKKTKSGYKITVSLGYDTEGKQIRKCVNFTPTETAPTKIEKEVQAFAVDFEKRVKEGRYFDGDNLTFKEFSQVWERDYGRDNLSKSILEGYQRALAKDIFPEIGNLKLVKIKAPHIQEIYRKQKERGLSTATIKRTHSIVSGIFKRAYVWGLIEDNPCSRVALPKGKEKKEMKAFNVEQAETFLEALRLPYKHTVKQHSYYNSQGTKRVIHEHEETNYLPFQFVVLFNLAVYSGCRRGELVALTWNDINFKEKRISITKSTATVKGGQIIKEPKTKAGVRDITLPKSCFDLLKQWKKEELERSLALGTYWVGKRGSDFDDNFIFIQDNGLQMHMDTLTHKIKEIIQMYNEQYGGDNPLPEIRFHDLRHTNATLLISQNTDVRTVSARLGHSKTSVTLDIYTHALQENDEKAAENLENLLRRSK